ncbi:MAG: magnesium transporter [Chloroflexi bacterium]|nr:magnesium transporter [Chloroflexota bacterium]
MRETQNLDQLSTSRLKDLLAHGEREETRDFLQSLHPADIADLLDELEESERLLAFNLLDDRSAAEVLDEAGPEASRTLLNSVPEARLAILLATLPRYDAAELLAELPEERAGTLLEHLPAEAARDIRELLSYQEHTAGRLMTKRFVRVQAQWTVEETIQYLRRLGPQREAFYNLYAVDERERLVGIVPLRALLTSPPEQLVRDIMRKQVMSVRVLTDQEEVARLVAKYDFVAIPVVDHANKLVGVITVDDVVDVLTEEATEDIQRLGGAEPLDQPYLTSSIPAVVRKRFGWLLLLFVAESLTGSVLRHFEHELQVVVGLAFFVPLLIGTGGNAGSQVVSTVIRGLALQEIRFRDLPRVFWREILTGAFLGLLMATAGYVRAISWGSSPELSMAVALALVAIVVWANAMGTLFPLVATRLGIDPTVMSAPFISTIVDASGLFIYFSVAKLVLGI